MSKKGNKTQSAARRKLMKTLVLGSGAATAGKLLPAQWRRPVVASVMLPAHAQVTNCGELIFSLAEDRTLTQSPPGTLTGSLPFDGTISGGTFSATSSLTGGTCFNGPSSASIYASITGTVGGQFFINQSVFCGSVLAAYCSGSGTATYIADTNVALSGSYTCTACTNIIQVSTGE